MHNISYSYCQGWTITGIGVKSFQLLTTLRLEYVPQYNVE
jgi:hypothetical protein